MRTLSVWKYLHIIIYTSNNLSMFSGTKKKVLLKVRVLVVASKTYFHIKPDFLLCSFFIQ